MAQNSVFTLFNQGHFYEFSAYVNPQTKKTVLRPRFNVTGKGVRTFLMQVNRTRWRNVQNAYTQMQPILEGNFTIGERKQSNYNRYMAANIPKARVYLTKKEAEGNVCVLDNFVVATGSLPSVTLTKVGNKQVSNIRLKGITAITNDTTVGEFATALVNSNILGKDHLVMNLNGVRTNEGMFMTDDKLTFLRVVQDFDVVPRIYVERHVVVLDGTCLMKLRDVAGTDGFGITHTTINGVEGDYLSCDIMDDTAVTYIISRTKKDDSVEGSTQSLVGESSYTAAYISEDAMLKAIDSYGGVNRNNYLRPGENTEAWKDTDQGAGSGSGDPAPAGKVTITTAVSPAGAGTVDGGGEYSVGAEVKLTATAVDPENKPFTKWSDGVTANPRTFNATTSQTYTALFGTQTGGGDGGID